jgi:hypothetical protein
MRQNLEQLLMTRGLESSRGRGGEIRKNKSRDQCYNCEEYGHHSYECPSRGIGKKKENVLLAEGFSMADDEPALL